jgi:hypothetical protein
LRRIPILWLAGAVLAGTALAWARPPEGVPIDPTLHEWYESLKEPGTLYPCCSEADCRPTEYRMGTAGYEIWAEDHWMKVPGEKVLVGYTNPVGRAVVCRSPANGSILCFVPANET